MPSSEKSWEERLNNYLARLSQRATPTGEAGRTTAARARPFATARHSTSEALSTVRLLNVKPAATVARAAPAKMIAVRKRRPLVVRPQKTLILARMVKLPTITVVPVRPGPRETAVRSGGFLLWPDSRNSQAFFLCADPSLLELGVVVHRGSDFRIQGGTASLMVSVLPALDTASLVRHHAQWAAALSQAGLPSRSWRFLPLQISRLDATLKLPDNHRRSAPTASANALLGSATFVVHLTALGAQVWVDALTSASGTLPGVCQLTARFSSENRQGNLVARPQTVSGSLQSMAQGFGAESVRTINPEVEIDATLLVDGHPTIEAITVEMRASTGEVETELFGSDGGTVVLRLASSEPESERVDWSVRVSFASASWPAVRASGALSNETGWADLINPASWIRQVTVTTMLVDSSGDVMAPGSSTDVDPANKVTGSLDFSADFLEGDTALQTTFETSSQQSTTAFVPRPPGTNTAVLKLTVFALREGRDDMQVRQLADDEQWVLVKVYPNARIELVTNRSPESTNPREQGIRETVRELGGQRDGSDVLPCVHAPSSWNASDSPPRFSIAPGANAYWALEATSDYRLFESRYSHLRSRSNFWSSADAPAQRLRQVTRLTLPEPVWAALRHARRLYYRLWTSQAPDAWRAPETTLPNALAAEAPFVEIIHEDAHPQHTRY